MELARALLAVVMLAVGAAAAAQFIGSTPTAVTAALPMDDSGALRASVPPAAVLAGACERTPPHDARIIGAVAEEATTPGETRPTEATLRSPLLPTTSPLDDDVLVRIRRAVGELRTFTDDFAVEFVYLNDDEYRVVQEQVFGQRQDLSPTRPLPPDVLPSREPQDVDAWAREPIDLTGVDEADGDSFAGAVARLRRRAVREYRFEVARLRPASLREYAGHRDERRRASTRADASAFGRAFGLWIQRQQAWVFAEADSAQDDSELESIVRSNPRRHWTLDRTKDLQEVFDNAMLDSFPDAHVRTE
ncbi:MAG: hypothetical protein U1E39_14470 [Planctomycetota bacterium]